MQNSSIEDFPITPYINQICSTLKNSSGRTLVLTAETGAGKSTILPIGLLQNFTGKILVTEPRRLAVLGVAERVSQLCNETPGQTTGYKIHLENKISEKTRLQVVTEAILVKQLQQDPALEEFNVVVLDEFHERSVNLDLALAFLKEALTLRDDLFVIVMSATIDCEKIAAFLGTENSPAPVIKVPGRTFPVTVEYKSNSTPEDCVLQELKKSDKGNILVFLPGIKEIKNCYENLNAQLSSINNTELYILHSSISIEEQKKILKPNPPETRRIIISSAIAETSLTVPGVTCVIDSGLSRIARININTGMENLHTESESVFSAEQRKGRAGRTENGKCIRLWNEFEKRITEVPSEILRCDLSELVLECADRGVYDLTKVEWLDNPNKAEWTESVKLLKLLNLLDKENHLTLKGKAALSLGISPRLAALALTAKKLNLLKETENLILKYSSYSESSQKIQQQFIADLNRRLEKANLSFPSESEYTKETIILAGFPDRVAKKIEENTQNQQNQKCQYQFYGGRKAVLASTKLTESQLPQWIVAPEVIAGTTTAKIYAFEQLPQDFMKSWLQGKTIVQTECTFEKGKIKKTEITTLGKIILSEKSLPSTQSDYAEAWTGTVKKEGLKNLPQDKNTELFLQRCNFYWQQNKNESLENHLLENLEQWLTPFINTTNLSSQNVYDGLFWFLDGKTIEKEVPETIILENGNKAKIKYEMVASPEDKNKLIIRPIIEIIIQKILGCKKTPEICGVKVLLRLLSPASRPLQITDDLEGFWETAWPQICKEMKGRYPKHKWE